MIIGAFECIRGYRAIITNTQTVYPITHDRFSVYPGAKDCIKATYTHHTIYKKSAYDILEHIWRLYSNIINGMFKNVKISELACVEGGLRDFTLCDNLLCISRVWVAFELRLKESYSDYRHCFSSMLIFVIAGIVRKLQRML